MGKITAALFIICLIAMMTGCNDIDRLTHRIEPMRAVAEVPAANLPTSLRYRNWTDARGSGSCVIASSNYNHNWVGDNATAVSWRQKYAGGQTETSIRRKHDAEQLPYVFTRTADAEFLKWVSRTRRSALIWFWKNHCVNFVGFHRDPNRPTDPTMYAWLCDNNRPTQYIPIPVNEFFRRWAQDGGFGLAREAAPVPPPLFNAVTPIPQGV
ncbi:hypothetical protein [Rhodopirellula bahusiensis]|uniref:hypothetical protein n=2 Tax=Rhodopirellula bahusiensis TaxID=2014065 RepID=UPI00326677D4